MSEVSANDVAFLKISKELHLIRNSLTLLLGFQTYGIRQEPWNKSKLAELDIDNSVLDEWQFVANVIPFMIDDGSLIREQIKKLGDRRKELEDLSEVYLKGGDIVMEKLSRD